jgi:hypothetical protein
MRWLRAALACTFAFALVACVSDDSACGCLPPPDAATYEMYVLTSFGDGAEVVAREFEAEPTDDPVTLAVTALLHFTPPSDAEQVNGWAPLGEPISGLQSVDVSDASVLVTLTKDVWDPYPLADLVEVPDGGLTLEQLVRTVQAAVGDDRPVRVEVGGTPIRGVWLTPVS